ncbi:MAG: neutral zinc metallopeptidase [Geminicoccaceae bacterium]|jgi:predicted metalloprotease|nr:neutral zinc metallopeptidase [Geminicoccaceae bacterium]HRY27269.1 neutral zinc metallopeptidase [Geminicoccaceae bacterium]
MEWRGRRGSKNVIDVRGRGRGGGRSMGRIGGFGGIGAVAIVLIGLFLGVDLTPLLGLGSGGGMQSAPPVQQAGPNRIDDEAEEFVSVVLADTEEVWSREFEARGARYEVPELVLFTGAVDSACGTASSAVGPFYCPGDHRVYLDTAFFQTLESQLGARGDFARAYVIAHEVGHHVQNLIGVMDQVNEARRSVSEVEANALSVRVELQADCLAGMWARGADEMFGTLERGDIDEALDAAARIGDDTLQRQSQGRVVPDSFTHGTSEQRQAWFYQGFEQGSLESCDTFSIDRV